MNSLPTSKTDGPTPPKSDLTTARKLLEIAQARRQAIRQGLLACDPGCGPRGHTAACSWDLAVLTVYETERAAEAIIRDLGV